MIIYYVGARLSLEDSLMLESSKSLHATIIYSKTWFPFREGFLRFPIYIKPPYKLDKFGEHTVLRFESPAFLSLHKHYKNEGASWDYPDYKAHITLSRFLLPHSPLLFTHLYYRTWNDER